MTTQRTIVVTGGSRGIGAAICRKLAASGYPVALNYMSNAAAAAAVVQGHRRRWRPGRRIRRRRRERG